MATKLEKLDEMCYNHLRLMRQSYVADYELQCRNCEGLNKECKDYKPVKNTGSRYSYLRLYHGNNNKD